MEKSETLRESKLNLRKYFPQLKQVSFLHSRANQENTLNGWMEFENAKNCSDVKKIIEADKPFGLVIMKEVPTRNKEFNQLKIIKPVFSPKTTPKNRIDENIFLQSDVMYYPSSNATWFD